MPQRPKSQREVGTAARAAASARRPFAARGTAPGRHRDANGADGTTQAARRPAIRRAASRAPDEPTTRELILTSAAAAFAERGYCGVNLADVVEELGFTKGALYFYFPNKESLASEIVDRHFAAWEPLVPAALEKTDDYLEALVMVTHQVADAFRSDPIARAGTRLSSERNLINADLPEPFVGWIARLTDLLRKAQAAGQLQDGTEPRQLARLIVSFFYGAQAVSEHLTSRDDLHRRLDEFWALVLPQLRTSPAAPRPRSRARTR